MLEAKAEVFKTFIGKRKANIKEYKLFFFFLHGNSNSLVNILVAIANKIVFDFRQT